MMLQQFEVSPKIEVSASALDGPRPMREALPPIKVEIDTAEHERRIEYVMNLGLPNLSLLRDIAPPGARVLIVGGGPSVGKMLPYIRERHAAGWTIAALNVGHDWLLRNGVTPHFGIMLDPSARVAGYQTPTAGVRYLIASMVHPSVWQRFREAGHRPFWYVPISDANQHEVIMARYPKSDPLFVSGPTTVGTRAINIFRHMGWQTIDCAGFDSCYSPGYHYGKQLYAYPKPHIWHDARELTAMDRKSGDKLTYISNVSMARQVLGFHSMVSGLRNTETNGRIGGVRLILHGDGVLPWMAWKAGGPTMEIEHADPAAMRAKYGTAKHWNYDLGKPV